MNLTVLVTWMCADNAERVDSGTALSVMVVSTAVWMTKGLQKKFSER